MIVAASEAGDARPIAIALQEHLRAQALPLDSGVSLRWVRVRFLGVPVWFPNFDARRAILVTHDVHHLLTGYDTTWCGEGAIGGYEIASGCRHYWAAWLFNCGGFLFGLCIAPRATWHGFRRGRHARNFYGEPQPRLLARTVAAARAELGLDRPPPPADWRDVAAFGAWVTAIVTAALLLPGLALAHRIGS